MKKGLILLFALIFAKTSFSHLCNDVFMQAKDNLAVKVDVRDGQLHIAKSGKFRVFLLNTMDRPILEINLAVESEQFDAKVTPSPEWKSKPYLESVANGGKKEYFDVELTRKEGIGEGKYHIGLKLYGQDEALVYKSVDLAESMALFQIPEGSVKMNDKLDAELWKNSLLLTSMKEFQKRSTPNMTFMSSYQVECEAKDQTRFRFLKDSENLYCLIDPIVQGKNDTIDLFVAGSNSDSKAGQIRVDLAKKTATLDGQALKASFIGKKIQVPIPIKKFIASDSKTIVMNMVRDKDGIKSYLKGNNLSYNNPVVFSTFVVK